MQIFLDLLRAASQLPSDKDQPSTTMLIFLLDLDYWQVCKVGLVRTWVSIEMGCCIILFCRQVSLLQCLTLFSFCYSLYARQELLWVLWDEGATGSDQHGNFQSSQSVKSIFQNIFIALDFLDVYIDWSFLSLWLLKTLFLTFTVSFWSISRTTIFAFDSGLVGCLGLIIKKSLYYQILIEHLVQAITQTLSAQINRLYPIIFYHLLLIFQQQTKEMKTQKSAQYTNNASGNLNKQQQKNKYKIIDLDEFDVEMVSPHFLQNKTLKKPLKEYEISSIKTNPNGLKQTYYQYQHEAPTKEYPQAVIFKKDQLKNNKREKTISLIDASQLNIKPAFKKDQPQVMLNNFNKVEPTTQKDSNTILSAMIKKGMKPQAVIKPQVFIPKQEKKAGPAESKLKTLMGKSSSASTKPQAIAEKPKKQELKRQKQNSQIGEQINEDIDEYGNQSFQKLSGAYESVIRQSIIGQSNIRQSIAGDSIIKQSIRESIRESVISSSGKIKESIRQDIKESIQQSSRSLKEEIIEEISASHRKSKESIQEVYEQVFEEQSSNSLSKSQSRFKKSVRINQSDSLSQSASKSFRMKNIAKSLKYAEELVKKDKIKIDLIEDKKIADSIKQQKSNLKRIQENISKLLVQKPSSLSSDKNKDLYYNFKIQVNRLLTGDLFQLKLKKLVSFLTIGNEILPSKQYVDDLQSNILKNIMTQIENIKVGKSHLNQIEKIKKQYENKLTQQLRVQQVNLRAQMNQKLSEKDLQLKKMIAELESRMMGRTVQIGGGGLRESYPNLSKGQLYEVESDYSIDSDNISWKADLWQLLPEYEKKKLYEKQTAQVTKFLADVMINQIKQQALERSLDISFEFPEEYNLSNSYEQPSSSKTWKENVTDNHRFMKKQSEVKHQRQFLSDLPKIPMKKVSPDESKVFNAPKEESQTKFEAIRRDQKIKPQVIKILSEYKNVYLKKKQEAIRQLLKVVTSKDSKVQNFMYSSIQQISILNEKEYKKDHQMYIKAYEQELIMSLVGIYTRSINKKQASIEEQMKKMYDRLVVVAQIAIAQKCIEKVSLDVEKNAQFNVQALTKDALKRMEQAPCTIEILASENYMDLKAKKQEKQVKNQIVEHIVNILSSEFAKEFPKRKK